MMTLGVLWDEEIEDGEFTRDGIEESWREFGRIARESGIETVHGHFRHYSAGKLSQGVVLGEEGKRRVENVELDAVFDKFKFDSETSRLKREMDRELPVLNRFELEEICKDKLLTYEKFPRLVPETVEASREAAERFIQDDGKVVVKPRFEFGGRGVSVIDSADEMESGPNSLLQRYVDASTGIESLDVDGVHDLRVLVVSGEPALCYAREASEGFVANVSRGASIRFVELEDLPTKAAEVVREVAAEFERYSPSFYSIDMVFDPSGDPHVLEFNSKPGLGFHGLKEVKKRKSAVMERIVEELAAEIG
jgi:glutathione synthase/RimK-type ligase-like ATP-grasp enzyme